MSQITVDYSCRSTWVLDFDINTVADWYVEWDILYVKHKKTQRNYIEYKPYYAAKDLESQRYKRPVNFFVDNQIVKN